MPSLIRGHPETRSFQFECCGFLFCAAVYPFHANNRGKLLAVPMTTPTIDSFTRERFDAGAIIFKRGDPGDSAYVIEDGSVEVLKGDLDDLQRVTVLTQGAMFGEVALLDHQPRTATVRALGAISLIRIDRNHVEELLVRADPVIQYLLRLLLVGLDRARHAQQRPGLTLGHLGGLDPGRL